MRLKLLVKGEFKRQVHLEQIIVTELGGLVACGCDIHPVERNCLIAASGAAEL